MIIVSGVFLVGFTDIRRADLSLNLQVITVALRTFFIQRLGSTRDFLKKRKIVCKVCFAGKSQIWSPRSQI